jgi:hypothetical protein
MAKIQVALQKVMNRFLLYTLGFPGCLVFVGCSVYENAARTLWCEPLVFSTTRDDCRSRQRYDQLASEAWNSLASADPKLACSAAYESGFTYGFADFMYAGGSGEPPPVPPRRFWNLDYRTPTGHQAVEDWFAGFRHGVAVVREHGYREQAAIGSSLPAECPASSWTTPYRWSEPPKTMESIPPPLPKFQQ